MDFWRSMAGMMALELTAAEPEQALAAIAAMGVEIRRVNQKNTLTYGFTVRRSDYGKIETLCRKRGYSLSISGKTGVYWVGKVLLHRPVLICAMVLFLSAAIVLPGRIFFIRVDGNETIQSSKILEAAEQCGICFGASRREVRSEQVKNALLSQVPQLQWVGVNTAGCVAILSVQERSQPEDARETPQISSITAARDGYVMKVRADSGEAVVQPGQTVQKGQLLISGYVDCGPYIHGTRSRGEVIAQTNREIAVITPTQYLQKVQTDTYKKKYSLLIRKKRINLWKDSGILDSSCDRMYEEYYITLPGGFSLPIALCVDIYAMYVPQPDRLAPSGAETSLVDAASRYVTGQMIAGEILSQNCTMTEEKGLLQLHAAYTCMEMIGRERQEGIGDTNGKGN